MTSFDTDDRRLGKAMERLLNKEYYLEELIKEPLQETFKKISDKYGPKYELMDAALLLLFTQIDLLGRLYAGETSKKNTAKNAVTFMRKYLGKIDKRYKEVSGLLYIALRNGYVHVGTPKRIKLKNGEELDFSFTTYHKNIKFLSIQRQKEDESRTKTTNMMSIHISQLYENLIAAIDLYADDIQHVQTISERFKKSFESRRIGDTEEKLIEKDKDLEKDFTYIYRQIQNKK